MRLGCGLAARIPGIVAGMALVTLEGCALFAPPPESTGTGHPPVLPATWSTAAGTGVPPAPTNGQLNGQLAQWWRRFNDPLLDQLIDAAMQAAPDLRAARANLRQARAARDLAAADLYPSLAASATASRSKTGAAAGGTGNSQTIKAAGFDASWEPSIFGGKSDTAAAAESDLAASEANLAAAHVTLAAEVALDYVTLRAYQQRIAIARANAASQTETLQITDWRQQAGLVTMLNVEQARTNLEQSRATIPSLEVGRAEAAHRLAILTGQAPAALAGLLREPRGLPRAPDDIAIGIPADTLRQRPDLRAAELSWQAETARAAGQRAATYPTLSFSANWGWKAFSSAALGGSDTLAQSLAGGLAATLFDGGRLRARVAAQDAVQERALITYEASILTALEDVENALVAYAAGRERIDIRRRAADSARNAAQLARTLFDAGAVDFQQVLDTERTRLSAEDGLASAESDLLAAVIKLYKALGGGWQAAAPTKDVQP